MIYYISLLYLFIAFFAFMWLLNNNPGLSRSEILLAVLLAMMWPLWVTYWIQTKFMDTK